MRRILLAMLAAILPWIAQAYDFSANLPGSEQKLYYQFNADRTTVSVAMPPETYVFDQLFIPSEVSDGTKTYKVTGIASKAFYQSPVSRVELPATIETIGPDAFGFSDLAVMNFPASLKSIGKSAFYRSKLQSADMKEGIETIGGYAFADNSNLTEVMLPSTLKTIENGAFYSSNIIKLSIPGSITVINDGVFQYCYNLSELTIGEGIESIGRSAFSGCRELNKLVLPGSLISTDYEAFKGCGKLEEIKFGSKLTTIGANSFEGCGFTEIVIPDNVTKVDRSAFRGCKSLETIAFSKNMEIISEYTCGDCTKLYKVIIPEGIKYIGSSAFRSCELLSHIDFPNSVEAFRAPTDINYYGTFWGAGLTDFNFPPKVTVIPSGLLASCKNLTKVVIPDHIKTIEGSVFNGCSSLEEVVIPDHIETLPNSIFQDCTSLPSFKFPKHLKKVDDSAFDGCTSMSGFQFSDSIIEFGKGVFDGCTKVKEIVFPPLTETFGSSLFRGCTNLQSITFSPRTKSVYCFSGTESSLQEVHVPTAIPPAGYTLSLVFQPMIAKGNNVTLYVPVGSKAAYEQNEYWNTFSRIVEEEVAGVEYGVKARIEGSGSVEINGTRFNYNAIPVAQGEKAVVKFIPSNEDWMVAEVSLNGKDVTAEVVDNEYVIESISENCEFAVRFARCPVTLTIHSGESGVIRIPVDYNNAFSCSLAAAEGWKLVRVTMDGRDVTAEVADGGMLTTGKLTYAADIYVTYEKISGLDTAFGDAVTDIYADHGMINISGLPVGRSWAVYDLEGVQVKSGVSQGCDFTVSLPEGCVYIVKTADKTVKLAL